jgi:hypothetical protein
MTNPDLDYDFIENYKNNNVFFVEHALGHYTWSKQREILKSVQDNEKTAVRACHGSSKTFTAAEIAVWWFNIYPYNSVVLTTAPTHPQVEMLLWKEINSMYASSRLTLDGKCLNLRLEDTEAEKQMKRELIKKESNLNENSLKHFAYGFSTDRAERAEGFHAWNLLIIFDEAKGIDQWMWDTAKGAMTAGNIKWLVISTTDGLEQDHPFWKCFNEGSDWNKIAISAKNSPWVTGEKLKGCEFIDGNCFNWNRVERPIEDLKIQIASQKYIDDAADPYNGWGVDHVLYKTKVLGELSELSGNAIHKLSDYYKMTENHKKGLIEPLGKKKGGIDVAIKGDDLVAYKGQGLVITEMPLVIQMASLNLNELDRVEYICNKLENYYERKFEYELKVDATGVGISVASEMHKRGWKVIGIHNSSKAKKVNKYGNAISEMWYTTDLKSISCPDIPRLQRELTNRQHGNVDKQGRQLVESKDEYKKRNQGVSSDHADAFLLWVYDKSGFYAGTSSKSIY